MKLAVFFPSNPWCSWSMSHGIAETLKRMGHTVLPVIMPTTRPKTAMEAQAVALHVANSTPQLEAIKSCDAVIVSGPEHIGPWIEQRYGTQEWKNLGIPRAAWLHESLRREDQDIEFEAIQHLADHWFFAGIQDAERMDQEPFAPGRAHWLPLGVDTKIFCPKITIPYLQPEFDLAFLGLVYPKRQSYLNALNRHDHPVIRIGSCRVEDLHGHLGRESAELLARNYRSVKTFFNLPAMSGMLVSKITEVMACGTFLITPELPEAFGVNKNMKPFEHGKHLLYYSPSNVGYTAQLLREWTAPDKDAERAAIAEAGCKEVHEKHSLKVRMEQMLSDMCRGAVEKLNTILDSCNAPRAIPCSHAQKKAIEELSK